MTNPLRIRVETLLSRAPAVDPLTPEVVVPQLILCCYYYDYRGLNT